MPPGAGTATRLMWLPRSKLGSSIQSGKWSWNGTSTSRWRNGRRQVEAALDHRPDVLDAEVPPAVAQVLGVVDGQPRDVHGGGRGLHPEEPGVEPGQPLHLVSFPVGRLSNPQIPDAAPPAMRRRAGGWVLSRRCPRWGRWWRGRCCRCCPCCRRSRCCRRCRSGRCWCRCRRSGRSRCRRWRRWWWA